MEVDLSSNSVVLVRVEEKLKKPSTQATAATDPINFIPEDDEDMRIRLWLKKNDAYFVKHGDSQEEADDSDMDHSGQTDSNSSGYFMPGPPPSPAESEFIDVEKLSIGKAKTEENNQYVDMLTSTPARAFDVFCPRSGLKRRVNSDDGQLQSIVPCKAPRLHMPAQHQHQQFEGKVSLFSEPCDLLKSKSLSFNLKKSERKLQSGSLCNGNNIPSLKPQCTMRKLETSEQTEATGGVIERFFNWLFPDE